MDSRAILHNSNKGFIFMRRAQHSKIAGSFRHVMEKILKVIMEYFKNYSVIYPQVSGDDPSDVHTLNSVCTL